MPKAMMPRVQGMIGSVMNSRRWLKLGVAGTLLLLTACVSQSRLDSPQPATIAELSPLTTTAIPVHRPVSGPATTVVANDSALRRRAREKAISGYRNYLANYPQAAVNHDIRRRLADLLVESAAAAADLGADDSLEAARNDQAITLYAELLAHEPDPSARAELLYQLAKAQQQGGQSQRALTTLRQLINSYPKLNQRLFADAQFRLGELLFSQRAFAEAEQAYAAVVRLEDSAALYQQALSQLGWSLYRQGRYDQALVPFFALLDQKTPADVSREMPSLQLSQADQEQLGDLYRAVSLCFSYLAGSNSIADFFAQHGSRSYQGQIYRSLAELYERKGLFMDAAQTWVALALSDTSAADAPRYYLQAISLFQQQGASQSAIDTQQAFAERYGFMAGFWRQHDPSAFDEVIRQLQSTQLQLAGFYHRQALATGTAEASRQAERWYRDYLTGFIDSTAAGEMRFQLAELLYQRGDYAAAAVEYELLAYRLGNHSRSSEAGRSAIVALEQLLEPLPDKQAQPAVKKAHRQKVSQQRDVVAADMGRDAGAPDFVNPAVGDLDVSRERLFQSRLRFVQSYSQHDDAAAVLGQLASGLLERQQPAEAAALAESLLRRDQTLPRALRQSAWTVVGQARFQLHDYQQAEQGYRQALSLAAADDPRRAALQQGLAVALYRQADAALSAGQQRRAAQLYLQTLASAEPESALHSQAQVDAAAVLLGLQQWRQASTLLERFRTDHPQHPRLADVTQKLAFAYERSDRPLAAANEYLRLGQGEGEAALRRQALSRAAELYQLSAQPQRAIKALELYLLQFPQPLPPAMSVRQQLAELAAAVGDEAGRRRWLQDIVRIDQLAADASTRSFAARAALSLAEPQWQLFEQIPLVEPLQKNLANKLKAMKQALKALEAVTGYGVDAVTTAATYRIATLYHQLGAELLQSERPQGLSDEQLERYQLLLEEQAAPFEERAIELYQANVNGIARGLYDVWIAQSLERLAELWPVRYAKVEQAETLVEDFD